MLIWNSAYILVKAIKLFRANKMRSDRQEMRTKATETHRANIRKSLEHRLEVARAQGNVELIRVLEAEFRQVV